MKIAKKYQNGYYSSLSILYFVILILLELCHSPKEIDSI